MKLSQETNIVDEKLFCESHKSIILHGRKDKIVNPFRERLELYARNTSQKICKVCYEVYKENHQCG